jgi:hypothetical protein
MEHIQKENNHTRYNTDDLNAILDKIRGRTVTNIGTHGGASAGRKTLQMTWETGHGSGRSHGSGRTLAVRPLVGERKSHHYRRSHVFPFSDVVHLSNAPDGVLSMASPRTLSERDEYKLQMLGALGCEQPKAPDFLLEEVIRAVFAWRIRSAYVDHNDVSSVQQQVGKHIQEVMSSCKLRVMLRVEAGPAARRVLTPDEKLARLQGSSFYGPGGALEGPSWAWRSGHRAPTGKWERRIWDAKAYFERERKARNKYVTQIEALGGTAVPYETFPEYLRRMANELEGKK